MVGVVSLAAGYPNQSGFRFGLPAEEQPCRHVG